jgi:hypothetical protein
MYRLLATAIVSTGLLINAEQLPNVSQPQQAQRQKDEPHNGKDLAEQVKASKQRLTRNETTFAEVRNHLETLRIAAAPDREIQIGVSLAHLSLKYCLMAGDEWREQARLYTSAAQSAASDSKSIEADINKPPDQETAAKIANMNAELSAIQKRIEVLAAMPNRDQNEQIELADLLKSAERIAGLIAMVKDLIGRGASAEALKKALDSVNQRRRYFELQARSAAHQSLGYDFQCIGALQMLRELAEREKIESFRKKWEDDTTDSSPISGVPAGSTKAPGTLLQLPKSPGNVTQ